MDGRFLEPRDHGKNQSIFRFVDLHRLRTRVVRAILCVLDASDRAVIANTIVLW
jgi:hypothetical protein